MSIGPNERLSPQEASSASVEDPAANSQTNAPPAQPNASSAQPKISSGSGGLDEVTRNDLKLFDALATANFIEQNNHYVATGIPSRHRWIYGNEAHRRTEMEARAIFSDDIKSEFRFRYARSKLDPNEIVNIRDQLIQEAREIEDNIVTYGNGEIVDNKTGSLVKHGRDVIEEVFFEFLKELPDAEQAVALVQDIKTHEFPKSNDTPMEALIRNCERASPGVRTLMIMSSEAQGIIRHVAHSLLGADLDLPSRIGEKMNSATKERVDKILRMLKDPNFENQKEENVDPNLKPLLRIRTIPSLFQEIRDSLVEEIAYIARIPLVSGQ